jgi:hypothetical protein
MFNKEALLERSADTALPSSDGIVLLSTQQS